MGLAVHRQAMRSYTYRRFYRFSLNINKGGKWATNQRTENNKQQTENYPTSKRKCVIDGKRFIITRHFVGEKDLSTLMAEIAVSRANREMGL